MALDHWVFRISRTVADYFCERFWSVAKYTRNRAEIESDRAQFRYVRHRLPEFGGDLIQRVVGPTGQICGSILWEAKRTKNWSASWLSKVRDDQREAKADMALIVSRALPKGLQAFDNIDGPGRRFIRPGPCVTERTPRV
jgi:Uncharacterized protein conserved in bacteria (DUF2130)